MARLIRLLLMGCCALTLSCRDKEQSSPPSEAMLWKVQPGEEWIYQVTVSYPEGTQPKLWSEAESVHKEEGRVVHTFQRTKTYLGRRVVKEGKGEWDVIRMTRSGRVEKEEYLTIDSERIAFWGSKNEGDRPGPVINLSAPVDLIRQGMQGGDAWKYAFGTEEHSENARTFRVIGFDRVKVPAGEFEAIKVIVEGRSGSRDVKETHWFAPEVGFVKVERFLVDPHAILSHEVEELKEHRMRMPE